MPQAVIIDCLRTAVGRAPRGALRNTRPDDLAAIATGWRERAVTQPRVNLAAA